MLSLSCPHGQRLHWHHVRAVDYFSMCPRSKRLRRHWVSVVNGYADIESAWSMATRTLSQRGQWLRWHAIFKNIKLLFLLFFSRVGNSVIGFSIESIIFCDWKIYSIMSVFFKDGWNIFYLITVNFVQRTTWANWRSKIDGSDSIFCHKRGKTVKNIQKNKFFFLDQIDNFLWSFSKINKIHSIMFNLFFPFSKVK